MDLQIFSLTRFAQQQLQGENLSPLLFSIYVDDLENYLSTNGSVPLEVGKMFNTENVLKLLVFYSMPMTH